MFILFQFEREDVVESTNGKSEDLPINSFNLKSPFTL
jgi:hypothetical protein